jgi:hypothetical protein
MTIELGICPCCRLHTVQYSTTAVRCICGRCGYQTGAYESPKKAIRAHNEIARRVESFLDLQGEVHALREERAYVQGLPEEDWLRVTSTLMQLVALVARDASTANYATRHMVAAIDRGKNYVSSLRARAMKAEDDLRKAKARIYDLATHAKKGKNPWLAKIKKP